MFEITIEETREVIATTGKEYMEVGTEEVARDTVFLKEGEPRPRNKPVYGYSPETQKKVNVRREVLVQKDDELDLPAVIKSINFLSRSVSRTLVIT